MRLPNSELGQWLLGLILMAVATACSTDGVNTITNRGLDYQPIVDTKGVDLITYENDLRECKEYATQVRVGDSALAGALLGAVAGAAVGAAAGAVYDAPAFGAATGAAVGGPTGLAEGAVTATSAQETVIRRCLLGRGYSVLY